MIVAEQKPIDEILRTLDGFKNVLIAACGTCVTVCMAGGEKEALKLAALLQMRDADMKVSVVTPKRQCDMEFVEEILADAAEHDVVLSLGCGAGVQFMSGAIDNKLILPGLNTKFMGVTQDIGVWAEMCQGCGDCVLEQTGGVCPVTRCSKSNFNGPCGGSSDGKCEIDTEVDCGWQLIYDRLEALDQLQRLYQISEPKDWTTSRDGGPRKVHKKEMIL